MKEQKRGKTYSLWTLVVETLWVRLSIGVGKGKMEKKFRSKHIGYLGCELKLNGFSVRFSDRLGQFIELSSYLYRFMYAYIILTVLLWTYIILPVFYDHLIKVNGIIAASGALWSVYTGSLLCWYPRSLIWTFIDLTTTLLEEKCNNTGNNSQEKW